MAKAERDSACIVYSQKQARDLRSRSLGARVAGTKADTRIYCSVLQSLACASLKRDHILILFLSKFQFPKYRTQLAHRHKRHTDARVSCDPQNSDEGAQNKRRT